MAIVRTALRADLEIELAAIWWRKHRPSAPLTFDFELSTAFVFLSESWEAQPVLFRHLGADIRRYRLAKTDYFVFYRYDQRDDEVIVLSVWHARRGRDPFRQRR